ncbi:hypothetical protein [Paenibacillus radicis (ex Gao et al. 2016)]|uniref:Uncharacterized protein n=1 Tax=Paenibacillus radicis (ex Gao et al. 2016) TaxID=1737354 RepID=A0A917LWT4_9BACL|nr:hypothetical protein [Paenibacillus radicis (ex Gao et al. 2016)]GGG60494.1 hypothetical protein GCM10010918_12230 [Paenibacillus radicis (ex Gao et al. 2016)]
MADNLSTGARSENMRAIRSKGTTLENKVAKELWQSGIRYRRNVKDLYGSPDISIKNISSLFFWIHAFGMVAQFTIGYLVQM